MTQLNFRQRRTIAIAVTVFALAIVWLLTQYQNSRLGHGSYVTGASCLAALLMLVMIGVRRRIPVLKLGSVSTWTQVHIYTGFFATAVYVMHVPSLIAGGKFEFGLSLLFWIVSISGFYGLYASRMLPRRLAMIRSEKRFDQMSWHRSQLATVAGKLIGEVDDQATSRVLGSYYVKFLQPFFVTRPTFAYVLVPSGTRKRRLLAGLRELNRYLEDDGRAMAGQFAYLVRQRDDLDYQFALQLRLRLWLVVHAVFSIMLVAGSIMHAFVAWRFTS